MQRLLELQLLRELEVEKKKDVTQDSISNLKRRRDLSCIIKPPIIDIVEIDDTFSL